MSDLNAYFRKKGVNAEEILYIRRLEKKTVIHCADGRDLASMIPVHALLEFLPPEEFLSIAKGVVVRKSRIVHIDREGRYTMADGACFQGRRRGLSAHRQLCRELKLDAPSAEDPFVPPMGFYEKCAILDDMPLAFCVIELVFNEDGHGVDFVFRYCNRRMGEVEGVPVSEMLNRSFYEVFRNGDRKWLVIYADVALNGTRRILRDFSPEIGKNLTIHCYQPEPGFCACVLLPEEE